VEALPNVAQTERDFQQQVEDLARLMHWRLYHTRYFFRSAVGFPNLVLVRPPRVLFAVLKSDDGICDEAQLAWLGDLERCHGIEVKLWRLSHWQEIVETLPLPAESNWRRS
jgi:hypothetical protein